MMHGGVLNIILSKIALGSFVLVSSFWALLSDLMYSSSIGFILENITRFLPRVPYIQLREEPSVLRIFLQFALLFKLLDNTYY